MSEPLVEPRGAWVSGIGAGIVDAVRMLLSRTGAMCLV